MVIHSGAAWEGLLEEVALKRMKVKRSLGREGRAQWRQRQESRMEPEGKVLRDDKV